MLSANCTLLAYVAIVCMDVAHGCRYLHCADVSVRHLFILNNDSNPTSKAVKCS